MDGQRMVFTEPEIGCEGLFALFMDHRGQAKVAMIAISFGHCLSVGFERLVEVSVVGIAGGILISLSHEDFGL